MRLLAALAATTFGKICSMPAGLTVIVLLIGMATVSCTANAQQPVVAQDPNGTSSANAPPATAAKATVFIYRQGSMLGAANYELIYIDDDYFATLRNDNYAQREVPQGPIVFYGIPRQKLLPGALITGALINSQKKKHEKLRMDVEAGKTYYVKWHLGKMKLVDAATGAKEVSGLNLAKD
jgi:hypothetical protein